MSVTRKQALAFFKAVLAAKNVQGVCEGILGVDEVPTIDDFKSRGAATLDKCETFTAHMMSCIKLIDQELHGRERQGEIDFDAKPGSKKKKSATKKTAPKLVKDTKKKTKKGGGK